MVFSMFEIRQVFLRPCFFFSRLPKIFETSLPFRFTMVVVVLENVQNVRRVLCGPRGRPVDWGPWHLNRGRSKLSCGHFVQKHRLWEISNLSSGCSKLGKLGILNFVLFFLAVLFLRIRSTMGIHHHFCTTTNLENMLFFQFFIFFQASNKQTSTLQGVVFEP